MIRSGQADRADALPEAKVIGEFDSFAGNMAGWFGDRTYVAFSPDGSRLAAAAASDTVRLYNTADWSLVRDLRPEQRNGVDSLAFTPKEGLLLVEQSDKLRLYNSDGEWLGGAAFPDDDHFGRIGEFSEDGRIALVWGQETLNLPARRSQPLLGNLGSLRSIDGSFTRGIFRWRQVGTMLVDLRGPDPVRKVSRFAYLASFSRDGRVLVHREIYREGEYDDPKYRLIFRRAPGWEVVGQVGIPSLGHQTEARPLPNGREIVIVGESGFALVDTNSFRAQDGLLAVRL